MDLKIYPMDWKNISTGIEKFTPLIEKFTPWILKSNPWIQNLPPYNDNLTHYIFDLNYFTKYLSTGNDNNVLEHEFINIVKWTLDLVNLFSMLMILQLDSVRKSLSPDPTPKKRVTMFSMYCTDLNDCKNHRQIYPFG